MAVLLATDAIAAPHAPIDGMRAIEHPAIAARERPDPTEKAAERLAANREAWRG
jgi:hypothetical protein